MSKKTSRRQFIKNSAEAAVMLGSLDMIMNALMAGKAYAQSSTGFKNFVFIALDGAPPRWCFDLMLGASANVMKNPMVCNKYTGSATQYSDAAYETVPFNGHQVPYLWNQSVSTMGGLVKPSILLNNMINIGGIDVLSGAHPAARRLHQSAVPNTYSLSSIMADLAQASTTNPATNLIRAISLDGGSDSIYKSWKGNSALLRLTTTTGNNLQALFEPMKHYTVQQGISATTKRNTTALKAEILDVVAAMNPTAKEYYKTLLDNSERANDMIIGRSLEVFQNLTEDWTALYTNKYKKIITDTLARTYAGINDKPIKDATSASQERYNTQLGGYIPNNLDVNSILSGANLDKMAAQFAVAEFLLKNGISPSISIHPSHFDNVTIGTTTIDFNSDQHSVGYMVGVHANSMFYLAFSACLIEFVQLLKTENIFDDTLIYFGGEFNRSARFDGGGSDHGTEATSVTLISGKINGFKPIACIYKDAQAGGYSANYRGSWGHGAPWPSDGKVLNIIQVWASMLRVLGVPDSQIPNAVDRTNFVLKINSVGELTVENKFNQFKVVV